MVSPVPVTAGTDPSAHRLRLTLERKDAQSMVTEQVGARTLLGSNGWCLWNDVAVRGAGFPARRILAVCDDELAAAADGLEDGAADGQERYLKVYAEATERLSAAIRGAASDPTLREAVTWQNPKLLLDCLDHAAKGEPRNVRGRNHELTIVSYLQRYCLKNDTVGFFGPVGWARLDSDESAVSVQLGPDLLARRTTYFEYWPIDVLADQLASRPEVLPWLTPRLPPHVVLTGRILRLPFAKTLVASPVELRLLARCDGRRTVRDLVGDPPDLEALNALLRLRDAGALMVGLHYDLSRWPELALAERIGQIPDQHARATALAPLTGLCQARDAVAAAAGDAESLYRATNALAEKFEQATGVAAFRRSGATYAGRTMVYEDTVRAVDVRLGRAVTTALAAPLEPLLDSATWLVNTVAERYLAACRRLVDRLTVDGTEGVPLLRVLMEVMPEAVVPALEQRSATVDAVVAEFQRRWSRVLQVPSEARQHRLQSGPVAEEVAHEFDAGRPRWSGARRHSPDVLIVADGLGAAARGEFELVLGELHIATNTLENRLFAAQHPEPSRLRAATEEDQLDGRVISMPRRDGEQVTSRLSKSSWMMLPSFTYLSIGAGSVPVPAAATVLPAADLVVVPEGKDGLVARRSVGGPEYGFVEVIGDALTILVMNAFRLLPAADHNARVSIDRLVVCRESWTFLAQEATWAFVKDERRRYAAARRWRTVHGIPERCFVALPVERKPMAVDFRSLPLVNLLGKSIRRTVDSGATGFTLSEMLPDLDRLWLQDAHGDRYTSELRFVAVHSPQEAAISGRP